MTTDAESLAAAAADECRRIIEEKDLLLTAARDERDAARDRAEAAERALSEARGHRDAMRLALEDLVSHLDVEGWRTYPVHGSVEGMRSGLLANARAAARATLPAPVPPGETTPDPTHRCTVCGALWILNPPSRVQADGSWSLWSKKAGPCCDNVAMGDQIEAISGFHRLCDPGPFGGPAAPAAHPETTRPDTCGFVFWTHTDSAGEHFQCCEKIRGHDGVCMGHEITTKRSAP